MSLAEARFDVNYAPKVEGMLQINIAPVEN
jgi:hypothetical protein